MWKKVQNALREIKALILSMSKKEVIFRVGPDIFLLERNTHGGYSLYRNGIFETRFADASQVCEYLYALFMREFNSVVISNNKNTQLKIISIKMPLDLLEEVDNLVKRGYFSNRSEAIRYLLKLGLEQLKQKIRRNYV